MGVNNALVTNEAPSALTPYFPAFFDKILVDAPCSGEGMFRKNEEAVSQWSQENVELIFLTAPSYKEYLETKDSYEEIHEYVKELAKKYQVTYWDFNVCSEEQLHLGAEDFMDVDHLNGSGAEKVTKCLAEFVLE